MAYGLLGNKVCIADRCYLKEKGFTIKGAEDLKNEKTVIEDVEIFSKGNEDNFNELFKDFQKITKVHISSENIELGEKMFCGCENLSDVYIHDNCTLGTGIFEGCRNLNFITCGGTALQSIGKEAFKDVKMRGINMEQVVDVGDSAFENCEFVDYYLSMPNLQTIGENAFKGSKNAKIGLNLNNLKFVGSDAFENAEGLEFEFIGNPGINEIKDDLFSDIQELLKCTEFIKKLKPRDLDVSTMRKINRKSFRDMLRRVGFTNDKALHEVVDAIGNQKGVR